MPLATKAGGTGQPATCKGCPLYDIGKGFVLEPAPVWSKIKMAIIGEAPGTNEVLQGKPFVGKAGWWLLRNILNPAGLKREEVYLDNTLRCLPPKNKQGEAYPVGVDKAQAEMHCRQYDRTIPASVPIMLVGGKALGQRLGLKGISDWHGHVTFQGGQLVGCTFHPSAVMRQPNLLPVAIREHYNLLTAHANPSILKHPKVRRGGLVDGPGPMVFDLEWDRKTKEISCVGVAYEAAEAYSTYDVEYGRQVLADRLARSELLIGHNIIDADFPVLGKHPTSYHPDCVFDTKVVAHLIHAHLANLSLLGLRSLVSYYRPTTGWKEAKDDLLEYNGRDCAYNFYLYEQLKADLTATNQWHLVEKQQRLARLAVLMRERGVDIDLRAVRRYHKEWKGNKQLLKDDFPFNPNSPKQVIEFFKEEGISLRDTKEVTVKRQADRHPLMEQLADYKELGVKPITTWFPLGKSKVHPTFNVTGTDVARFSSSEPNFQNIPPSLRRMIVALEGMVIVGLDFSQIENRCVAWLAGDKQMLADFASGMDFHRLSASRIYNKRCDDVTNKERYEGKKTIHASNYGELPANLAERLFGNRKGDSLRAAERLQSAYFSVYPAIREWQTRVSDGLEQGSITLVNPFGRVRYIYGQDAHTRKKKGCHYYGCSTAADIVNQRVLDIWQEEALVPILIVHDELVYCLPVGTATATISRLKDIMTQPVKEMDGLVVPVKAKVGANYGDLRDSR
jgi:uracil-DNA glycosylase family 4